MAEGEIIYLDNNATTQLDPAVIEEMLPFLTKYYGNPSSGYGFAATARKAINLARERLAALLGCEPTEIVFTSGGTESNNAVINSALQLEARSNPPQDDSGGQIWSRARSNTARSCVLARISQNEDVTSHFSAWIGMAIST